MIFTITAYIVVVRHVFNRLYLVLSFQLSFLIFLFFSFSYFSLSLFLFHLFFLVPSFSIQIGTYFFSSDVNRLIIGPIERLVDLVRKISANPLGVEYKMLGEKEGFLEGMETTILLTTINKIGGLMQVGFGEAGATVIAKNLADSSGGRLNLMGGGTMIQSIFGFCDVRYLFLSFYDSFILFFISFCFLSNYSSVFFLHCFFN